MLLLAVALLVLAAGAAGAAGVGEVSSAPGETSLSRGGVPAGAYTVTFRLQIDSREQTVTPVAALAVSVTDYPSVVYQVVTPIHFAAANTPQDFTFLLDNFRQQDLQATVGPGSMQNKTPTPKLTVDKITLTPLHRPGGRPGVAG